MVTLGEKIQKMQTRSNGSLTKEEDESALLGDMSSLTGVTLAEIQLAASDSSKREEVLLKIAEKLGTT